MRSKSDADLLRALPLPAVLEGSWSRAGGSRASVIARGLEARLAETLIAQTCIDHRAPLTARDGDPLALEWVELHGEQLEPVRDGEALFRALVGAVTNDAGSRDAEPEDGG